MYHTASPGEPALSRDVAREQLGYSATIETARAACNACRKRKSRCDRRLPECGTCLKVSTQCGYPAATARKVVVSKTQSIKQVEGRLAYLEAKLRQGVASRPLHEDSNEENQLVSRSIERETSGHSGSPMENSESNPSPDEEARMSYELISWGVEESPPPKSLCYELFQLYFKNIHSHMPIIHQPRFWASLKLESSNQPPACLQYAMWCLAAFSSPVHEHLCDVFYTRARKYSEAAELHSWHIIATYEARKATMAACWMSSGRCVRLVQMMGLQTIDNTGVRSTGLLPPTLDVIEQELRRRIFWAAYFGDRWSSAGTGWPMTINEEEIMTRIPMSESAFERGIDETAPLLSEVLIGDGASKLRSPLGCLLVVATLLGRNFTHIHDTSQESDPTNFRNGNFWRRHRELDNTLSSTFMHAPAELGPSKAHQDPKGVFFHMSLHTSVISLHKASIAMATKHNLDSSLITTSAIRCIIAADGITNTMRMIHHCNISEMNPWTGFALFVAGGVYCHEILTSGPAKIKSESNLEFIIASLKTIETLHLSMKPFTKQLILQSRAAKGTFSRNATKNSTSSDTHDFTQNRFPDTNKSSNGFAYEVPDSDSGLYTNPPSPYSVSTSVIPGIMVETELGENDHLWTQAADYDIHQALHVDKTKSAGFTPHEIFQNNQASQLYQPHGIPAHVSASLLKQPQVSHSMEYPAMTSNARFHESRDKEDITRHHSMTEMSEEQNQGQSNYEYDHRDQPGATRSEIQSNEWRFSDPSNGGDSYQHDQNNHGAMQVDTYEEDEQGSLDYEMRIFQRMFPHWVDDWGMIPDDNAMGDDGHPDDSPQIPYT